MSQGNLWVDLVWGSLSFMYLDVHITPKIWEFSVIISLNKLSASFSPCSEIPVLFVHLIGSHNSCKLSSVFFFILFVSLVNFK